MHLALGMPAWLFWWTCCFQSEVHCLGILDLKQRPEGPSYPMSCPCAAVMMSAALEVGLGLPHLCNGNGVNWGLLARARVGSAYCHLDGRCLAVRQLNTVGIDAGDRSKEASLAAKSIKPPWVGSSSTGWWQATEWVPDPTGGLHTGLS